MALVLDPVVHRAAESPTQYWPVRHKEICPADAAVPEGATVTDAGACTYRQELTPEVWQSEVGAIHDFMESFGGRMRAAVATLCAAGMPDGGHPADGGGSPPQPDAGSDAP
jgi:hypothetical protein